MRKARLRIFVLFLGFALISTLKAQDEATRTEMEQILSRFSNYRFGNISIYRLKNIGEIRRAIQLRQQKSAGVQISEEVLKSIPNEILTIIEDGVRADESLREITTAIENRGYTPPNQASWNKPTNFTD